MDKFEFQAFLDSIDTSHKPTLLLHVCCGPCSSYCMEYLNKYFDITLYYYNPNIYPKAEYDKRAEELTNLNSKMYNLPIVYGTYETEKYYAAIRDHIDDPEGSLRCYDCMSLRMDEAAKYARDHHFDYFTTTLSISPHKNSKWINEIGYSLQDKYGIKYLYSDFKKNNGYLRSIELCKKYNVYRQDYCGCSMSMKRVNHE